MSEEEKKAIEKLNSKNETTWNDTIRQIKREEITDVVITRQKYITTILNLIDKQQKEIEELKEKDNSKYYHTINSKELENEINNAWKNKIRELKQKVEEEMISNPYDFSYMIQELLEEK